MHRKNGPADYGDAPRGFKPKHRANTFPTRTERRLLVENRGR